MQKLLLLLLISSFGFAQKQVETLTETKKAKEGKLYFESKSKGLFLFDGEKYQAIIGSTISDPTESLPPFVENSSTIKVDNVVDKVEEVAYLTQNNKRYKIFLATFDDGFKRSFIQLDNKGFSNVGKNIYSNPNVTINKGYTAIQLLNDPKNVDTITPNGGLDESIRHELINESYDTKTPIVITPMPTTNKARGINIWGGFGSYENDQSDLSFNYNQERMFLKDLPYRNQRPWYAEDVTPYRVPHHNQKLSEKGINVKELDYVDQKWNFGEKQAAELYAQFVKSKINYATFLCYNEGAMVTMRDQFISYIEKNNLPFEYYFTISFDKDRKYVMDFVASKMKSKWYKKINGKAALECFTDGSDFQKGIDVKNILKSQYGIDVYLIANENIGLTNVNRLKGNYDCVTKYYNATEIGSQRPNAIFDGASGLKEEWQKAKDNGLDYLPIVTLGIDRSARNAQWGSGVTSWYDHQSVYDNIPLMVKVCNEIAHPQLGWRISHLDENSEQGITSLMDKKRADGSIDTTITDIFSNIE